MQSEIKIGQRFQFTTLSDNPLQERQAVVTRVFSNREEALGPEAGTVKLTRIVRADPFDVELLTMISTGTSRRSTPGRPGFSTDGGAPPGADDVLLERDSARGRGPTTKRCACAGGLEPSHLALALAGRLMREFGPIVLVLRRAVHDRRHHATVGRRVAAQLVGDQPAGHTALAFQQLPEEAFGRVPITSRLHEDVDHVAVMVDGAPEILLAPLNGDEQFVQVPRVAQASLPAPQRARIRRPERATPLANRLVGHDDAPLGEEIFGVAEAQTEPVVEPDGVADDLGWKSIAVVAGGWLIIGLLCQPSLNLTMPWRLLHGTLVMANNTTHTIPREESGSYRVGRPTGARSLALNRLGACSSERRGLTGRCT